VESVYKEREGGEVLRKWARIWPISALMAQIVDRWAAQIEIPVQATRQRAKREYTAYRFRSQKGILG